MTEGNNNMGELNKLLFDEMRRLSSADAKDQESMELEVTRARAMTKVAASIIEGSNVVLKAAQMRAEYTGAKIAVPRMLGE